METKPKIQPVMDLLDELRKMTMNTEPIDMVTLKQTIRTNPFHRSMQLVLIEHKSKVPITTEKMDKERVSVAENESRLNNMLAAEGLIGPTAGYNSENNNEYNRNLNLVKTWYEKEVAELETSRVHFCGNVQHVLKTHGEFRPVTQRSIDTMTSKVTIDFAKINMQIKQKACEEVIQLRRRFCDARRTRRNFSQRATKILNDYFQAHIQHPYPTDEVKHVLAKQCDISVHQVSNWFGNKRIRYKKVVAAKGENVNPGRMMIPPPIPNPYSFNPMNPFPMMMPLQFGGTQTVNQPPFSLQMMSTPSSASSQSSPVTSTSFSEGNENKSHLNL